MHYRCHQFWRNDQHRLKKLPYRTEVGFKVVWNRNFPTVSGFQEIYQLPTL